MTREVVANPSFCSVERLGVFLLPPGWDASASQGYPPALNLPGGTKDYESKVSCPRK